MARGEEDLGLTPDFWTLPDDGIQFPWLHIHLVTQSFFPCPLGMYASASNHFGFVTTRVPISLSQLPVSSQFVYIFTVS